LLFCSCYHCSLQSCPRGCCCYYHHGLISMLFVIASRLVSHLSATGWLFPLFLPPVANFFALGWLFLLLSPPVDLWLLMLLVEHCPHCWIILLVPFICCCGLPSPLCCFNTLFCLLLSLPVNCCICNILPCCHSCFTSHCACLWCCWHCNHHCSLIEPSYIFVFCCSTTHCAVPMLVMPPLLCWSSCCHHWLTALVKPETTAALWLPPLYLCDEVKMLPLFSLTVCNALLYWPL